MNHFEKIQWSVGLSIGNDNVDKDHQKLLKIYNELVDLVILQKEREEFAKILSSMTDYSLLHFRKEEEYMAAFSYPKLEEHIQYHMNYIYRVSMFNIELSMLNPPDPVDILKFLEHWWIDHIMVKDLEYEEYKKSLNSKADYNPF